VLDKSAVFNEELHILYSAPNTVTAKSGKMRWAVNVACVEAVRNIQGGLDWETLREEIRSGTGVAEMGNGS
jgi:hypothetical protein